MNKEKITLLLIVSLVIIMFIISAILKEFKKSDSLEKIEQNVQENNSSLDSIIEVKDYFIIKEAIEKFYINCAKLNANEKDIIQYATKLNKQEWNEYKKIFIEEEQKKAVDAIWAILDSSYINEFNISKESIKKEFGIKNEVKIFIEKINKYSMPDSEKFIAYIVDGYYIDCEEEKNINFELVVNLNKSNNTYSILTEKFLKKYEYASLNKHAFFKTDNKGYNVFDDKEIEDSDIASEIFYNYKYNMLYNAKKAYSELEKSYRDIRFGSLENYKKYVKNNSDSLEDAILTKYQIEEDDNSKKYVCLDNFDNYYIFNVKNVMDYNLMLDTYTITSDKFKKEYTEGNDTKKCQLNIDKFFKMINNKDYTHAYEVLDEGFKNNYFKSQEDFEKFVSSRFYEFNNIKFNSASNEGDVYIFKLTVTNVKNSNSSFDMNIFIKLKDNMDFVMSFGKA